MYQHANAESGSDFLGYLSDTPLFSGLPVTELQRILRFCRDVRLARKDVLFRKDEACSAFYLVVSGIITLQVRGSRGQDKTTEFVEPGQTFGEDALFSGFGYPVDARALVDTRLIGIQAFPFIRHMQRHSALTGPFLNVLAGRLYRCERRIETLSLCAAEQRVVSYLLSYVDAQEQGSVQHIPPRRKEFASILGITVETLCRVLGSLKRRNLIQVDEHRITVLEQAQLEQVLRA